MMSDPTSSRASPSLLVTASSLQITGRSRGNDHDNEITINWPLARSGTYKAPERIRDYVDSSLCADRGSGTRETYCVNTMGEGYRSDFRFICQLFILVTQV